MTLIFIHGISTASKTTVGKQLSEVLPNSVLIDQDTYFKTIKPSVTYSNNTGKIYIASNWDSIESIDFYSFTYDIKQAMQRYNNVIVTGFALWQYYILLNPDISILLDYGLSAEETLNQVIRWRRISKRLNMDKYDKDEWMVRRVIWPFYLQTLNQIAPHTYTIKVYENGQRVPTALIVEEIMNLLR